MVREAAFDTSGARSSTLRSARKTELQPTESGSPGTERDSQLPQNLKVLLASDPESVIKGKLLAMGLEPCCRNEGAL